MLRFKCLYREKTEVAPSSSIKFSVSNYHISESESDDMLQFSGNLHRARFALILHILRHCLLSHKSFLKTDL